MDRWLTRATRSASHDSIAAHFHASEGEGASAAPTFMERFTFYRSTQFGVYLQRIVGKPAQQYHDHPWSLLAVVLCGAYRERYLSADLVENVRTVRWWSRRRPHDFHAIIDAAPGTWVLVLTRGQKKARGFLGKVVGDQAEYVVPNPLPRLEEVSEDEKLVV